MRPSLSLSNTLGLSLLVLTLAGAAFVACGLSPSRAPLGGDYATTPDTSPEKPKLRAGTTASGNQDAGAPDQAPEKHARAAAAPTSEDAGAVAESADMLRYDPLQTGDQIRAEVAFAFSAEIQSGSADLRGGNNKMVLDAKLHADVKILKSSAQSLDELELTLTPVSLHTELAGKSSDSKQDPPETYDVTLSGQAPNIRARSGATLEKEDRATLIVLITPLVEFHAHWARSPTLSLKPGWSSKIPLAAPAFMTAPGDATHVGPLSLRFVGRDPGGTSVPFELGLPMEWTTDIGQLNFDFNGRALIGAKGRPISLDLTGPLSGNAGPPGAQFGLRGSAKFAATLSYQ